MKVIKRNGQVVDFDREKIRIAIEKANKEVRKQERATEKEIKEIIVYIEDFGRKRMLVEDIQDIIEEQLMKIQKYELAKKYIVYRYTRALVRKQNTTDESILGQIRNEGNSDSLQEKNTMLASTQRDYIAGEVSRDLTKRMLLPEKISNAHEEGILYFHDADYFIQPIINYCTINIGDMLENGTIINEKMIETPKSFQVACIVMTQIIASVANNQYGEEFVDMMHLGKYLRKSYDKYKKKLQEKYSDKLSDEIIEDLVNTRVQEELKSGVQAIQYQINTLMTTNGKPPILTLLLHQTKNDPYEKENEMIIEEMLKQRKQGIKNEAGEYVVPTYPKLVYIDENYKNKEMFNQGIVSINLPQIGIMAEGIEETFWQLLEERLEICKEALMCRHYALLGTKSDISPIHWQYGAIARLKKGEKIDKYLYGGNSSLSLGYVGTQETVKLVTGIEDAEDSKYQKFQTKLINKLKDTISKWKKETNIGFNLYETESENIRRYFAKIDKEKFGTIKDITDKGCYSINSIDNNDNE